MTSQRTRVQKRTAANGFSAMPANFTELQGWSDKALAAELGCSLRVVNRWENATDYQLLREDPPPPKNRRTKPAPVSRQIAHLAMAHQADQLSSRYGCGSTWE